MTYVKRALEFSIDSGQGNTGEAGFKTSQIKGLRATAQITQAGDTAMGAASIAIYGMPLAQMNDLCYIGLQVDLYKFNQITVTAGDQENGMYQVFEGGIIHAWPDMQGAPDTCFRIEAKTSLFHSVKPSEPLSYSGPTEVAKIAETLAQRMGVQFENNGVSLQLNNPYLPFGGARQQMISLAKAARIGFVVEGGKLAIWPYGKPRKSAANSATIIAPPPKGRMVGYPASTGFGILCKEEFTRPRTFNTVMTVQSDITPACGEWLIEQVDYSLACEMPHGEWFTFLYGKKAGSGPVLPH